MTNSKRDDDIRCKAAAYLQAQLSVDALLSDPELPAILLELREHHRDLEQQHQALRRLQQESGRQQVTGAGQGIAGRKQIERHLQDPNKQLEQRVTELSALNHISHTLATVANLTHALNDVGHTLGQLMNARAVLIGLIDEPTEVLQIVAHCRQDPAEPDLKDAHLPLSNSVVRRIAEKKGALVIGHAQTDPRTEHAWAMLKKHQIQGVMMLPLLARDDVIGIVSIGVAQPNREFTQAEIKLAETVAGQIASRVEITRLFEEERRSRQIAESLREVTEVLSSSLNVDTVFEAVFDQLGRLFLCDGGGIFLHENDTLIVTAASGERATAHLGRTIPVSGQNPVARTFRARQKLLIADGLAESSWMDWPNYQQIYSWIGAPLLVGRECIGVLTVDSYRPHTYVPAEAEILQTFANHAALAIYNAKLHRQVQQDAETKAILLQEIHHRVKNNFQIISSLLSFQADYIDDEQAQAALRSSQRRVRAMAAIHNQLYGTPNLASIGLSSYLTQLTDHLVATYRTLLTHPIELSLELQDIYLPIETALPCGLIVNELVSNALKYAFPPDWQPPTGALGQVFVSIKMDEQKNYLLDVADNGVGLPSGFSLAAGDSLGMFLVQAFVHQLDGTFGWHSAAGEGVAFQITFPAPSST